MFFPSVLIITGGGLSVGKAFGLWKCLWTMCQFLSHQRTTELAKSRAILSRSLGGAQQFTAELKIKPFGQLYRPGSVVVLSGEKPPDGMRPAGTSLNSSCACPHRIITGAETVSTRQTRFGIAASPRALIGYIFVSCCIDTSLLGTATEHRWHSVLSRLLRTKTPAPEPQNRRETKKLIMRRPQEDCALFKNRLSHQS